VDQVAKGAARSGAWMRLTPRWSGCVKDGVPSSNIGAHRSAQPLDRMKVLSRSFQLLCLLACAAAPDVVNAVCLDPKTWISGYRKPFEEELKESIAIVVAKVVSERKVFEDPEDSETYSVIFTLHTEQVLKGNPLQDFKLRMELDSGRYGLQVGEKHLLFITKWPWKVRGAHYVISACGNSARFPEAEETAARVAEALGIRMRSTAGRQ